MSQQFIPVSKPYLTTQCKKFVADAVKNNDISGLYGDYIGLFEKEFSKYIGKKYSISCSSGTSALHMSIISLGLKKNDEILIADLTNMATFFSAMYKDLKIIPIDICKKKFIISTEDLKKKITSNTKAIIVVHLFGQPVDVKKIKKIIKNKKIKIIEDCAEAHGSEIHNKKVGFFGDIAAFSFFANKNLTTGEGGAILTNSKEIKNKIINLKNLSFGTGKNKFIHSGIGFNYRMTNMQAALGYSQTLLADKLINKRIQVCKTYLYYLDRLKEKIELPKEYKNEKNTFWMMHITLADKYVKKRDNIMSALFNNGIGTRKGFVPYSMQKKLHNKNFQVFNCPISHKVSNSTFYLPTYLDLGEGQIKYISQKLEEILLKI